MTDHKTIAIFGAGTGLGMSLAQRFGREGYRVALVARSAEALDERVAELARDGIEATAFPADLTNIEAIPALVRAIEERLGSIDVSIYAPVSAGMDFMPAADVNAAGLGRFAPLLTFAPVEVSNAVLPGMLARGDGAIVVVGGLSAVFPMPGMGGGVGPAMAAARNFIHTLNGEVKDRGVYAGTVHIGAMIDRSAGLRIATSGGAELDPRFPVIDPDDIGDEIWSLVTQRDRVEAILPPMPQH